jgi:membrane-associated phospholipid phosphatase
LIKNNLRLLGQGIFYTGRKNAIFSLLLAVGVLFTSQIYSLLNHGPAIINLHTPLDAAIPAAPVFVIPYISLQPYIIVTLILFLFTQTKYFHSACLAMLTVWLISYGFYYFLQSEVVRPVLTAPDIFSKLVALVYSLDQPFNDFPSLHTALSTILAFHWVKLNKPLGIVLSLWTGLIVASTLLIKQHYIADMIFGLLLAFAFSWLYSERIIKPSPI